MESSKNRVILATTFAAGAAPTDWQPVEGASLAAQCLGAGGVVQATNYREAATGGAEIVALGAVAGDGTPLLLETVLAYVRFVPSGAGSVRISAAVGRAGGSGGGGGGGGGDASAANQVTQIARLTTIISQTDGVEGSLASIDIKTPGLSGGKVPVTDPTALPLPTGAATEATLSAASGKLPASLGGKPAAGSMSVTHATGIATSISGSIASGGTAQQLAAENSARRGLTLQNTSSGELRVSPWGGASATAGYRVSSGEMLVLDAPHCGVGAVSVWGATAAQTFIGGESV